MVGTVLGLFALAVTAMDDDDVDLDDVSSLMGDVPLVTAINSSSFGLSDSVSDSVDSVSSSVSDSDVKSAGALQPFRDLESDLTTPLVLGGST